MITDKIQIDAINMRLLRDFRVLDGRPIYRIVWSETQYEMRKAVWRDFYGSVIIREYEATRMAPKYAYFKNPCWILEKLIFISGYAALKEIQSELVEAQNGTYEPLFAFKDKDEQPLPVFQRVVDVILWHIHNPVKRTASDVRDEMLLEEEQEIRYFQEQLAEGERSDLFVFENSAFVSTNQLEFRKVYKK
jgi:hypothetical protein